ncbi:MAG TPA: hypothetical protein VFR28_11470 [Allosphingosinicella sp.]|nr:hypothetical protein [Allosphingosinicella sp.]
MLGVLGFGRASAPQSGGASGDSSENRDAPDPPPDEVFEDERLPQSSLDRVLAIRALSADLEQHCRSGGLLGEMIELQRLRTSHLPLLLRSYVSIPPAHRAEVFRETGRSASYLLNERLDKILGRLHEMSRQLARGNLDQFTQNIRFVDMNYGSGGPFD